MAISHVASSGVETVATNKGTASTVVSYVGVPASGEIRRAFIVATLKEAGTAFTSITAGWTALVDVTGGENPHPVAGTNDNDRTRIGIWYRDLDGSETGDVTITATGGGSMCAGMSVYESSVGAWETPLAVTGDDASHAAARTAVCGSWTVAADDWILIGHSADTDNSGVLSAVAITQTGATFGTVTVRNRRLNGSGPDGQVITADAPVTAGSTNAPTLTYTWSTAQCGPSAAVRLRESAGGTVTGNATGSFTFGSTAAGTRAVAGTAAAPFAVGATAAGTRTVLGQASAPLIFSAPTTGVRSVLGAAGLPLTFTAPALGAHTVHGIAAATFTFSAAGVVLDPIITRPDTGTITRPGAGTTSRPTTGSTTRPGTGTVTRPDTGLVARP